MVVAECRLLPPLKNRFTRERNKVNVNKIHNIDIIMTLIINKFFFFFFVKRNHDSHSGRLFELPYSQFCFALGLGMQAAT